MEARRRVLKRGPVTTAEAASTDDRTSVSQSVERALSRSLALWREGARRAGADNELAPVERLADQLRRAARGDLARVQATLPAAEAHTFISAVRRALLEETRVIGAIGGRDLSGVLLAFDRVADEVASTDAPQLNAKLDQAGGTNLVVEVAHDMRSPLTSILFLVETLRKGHSGPVNAVQERQLSLVYSAAFGLSAIASDFIELARGGDRLVERTPIAFSVGELFLSVSDILLPMAEEKGLAIRLNPPAGDFRVGYPSALSRVLLNLATNAVKFTSRGQVTLSATQLSQSRIQFAVQDTGPGIPQELMGQLYAPLRRLEAGTQSFSSAGLGLAICSRLVSRMGGELEVVSSTGAGTRFSFELELPPARL